MNSFYKYLILLVVVCLFSALTSCKKKVEIQPQCGPFEPNVEWKTTPSDPEYIDTIFYVFQENLSLDLVECFEHYSNPGYTINEGDETVFMYYFYYKSETHEDIWYERTLVFEAPAVINTYYIDSEDFCDHNVYLKGEMAFGIINDELRQGLGCISIEQVENSSGVDSDTYEVSVNLPVKWHNDSTSHLQFTEVFTRTSELND